MCSAGGRNHSYEVRLQERTCSCGKWQNIRIQCSHAIRVCDYLYIDSITYIHSCQGLDNAINTYEHAFVVPKSQSLWGDPIRPKWLPNPALLRAKGRPAKSRIRNEIDGARNKDREPGWRREDANLIESQPKQTCGLCHASEHNRRKCPQQVGRWQKVMHCMLNCCSFDVYLMFSILSPNVITLRFSGMLPQTTFLSCGPPILGKMTTLYWLYVNFLVFVPLCL